MAKLLGINGESFQNFDEVSLNWTCDCSLYFILVVLWKKIPTPLVPWYEAEYDEDTLTSYLIWFSFLILIRRRSTSITSLFCSGTAWSSVAIDGSLKFRWEAENRGYTLSV